MNQIVIDIVNIIIIVVQVVVLAIYVPEAIRIFRRMDNKNVKKGKSGFERFRNKIKGLF